jgi:hypothetical protein
MPNVYSARPFKYDKKGIKEILLGGHTTQPQGNKKKDEKPFRISCYTTFIQRMVQSK